MRKKILIVGGNSNFGRTFKKIANKTFNIYETYSKISKKRNSYTLDLNNEDSILSFSKNLKNKKFNYLIFCPGILLGKKISEYSFDEIKKINNINYLGISKLISKIINKNLNSKCVIIFISSISGRRGSFDHFYAGAKAGLMTFAKSMSKYYGNKLRVNIVAPSVMYKTKMYKQFSKQNIKKIKNETPNNQILLTSDLVKIILDIMQRHWDHSNGSVIVINGGIF